MKIKILIYTFLILNIGTFSGVGIEFSGRDLLLRSKSEEQKVKTFKALSHQVRGESLVDQVIYQKNYPDETYKIRIESKTTKSGLEIKSTLFYGPEGVWELVGNQA